MTALNCPRIRSDDFRWIWTTENSNVVNSYAAFRLIIRSGVDPAERAVPIMVSASSMYQLWVNGHYVGRGPAREWLGFIGVDRYDIAPFLLPHDNVVSVLCHNAGEHTNAFQKTPPGFTLSGKIGSCDISTGRAPWEGRTLKCWKRNSSRMHRSYNRFNEEIDMGRYRPDVWERGMGAGWRRAAPTGAVQAARPVVVPREIPQLRECVLPKMPRAIGAAAVIPGGDRGITQAQQLMLARRARAEGKRIGMTSAGFPATVYPGAPVSLVFDLGGMTSGVLEFDIEASGGESLAVGYGDRLVTPGGEGFMLADSISLNPFDNHKLVVNATHGGNNSVDRFTLARGRNRWKGAFNLRGFRYAQFDFAHLKGALTIRSLRCHEITYPVELRGRFVSSDPQLNAIWKAGRRTLQLCMADTYLDNPSRERQQYGEDGFISSQCGYYYFGDTGLSGRFLRLYQYGMHADGGMESGGPWPWRQIIPAWTLLWIDAIQKHIDYTGDDRIGMRLAPFVRKALDWFDRFAGPDGLLSIPERQNDGNSVNGIVWNYIDWQRGDKQLTGEPARLTLNCIYFAVMKTAAEFIKIKYGDRAAGNILKKRAALGKALKKILLKRGAVCGEHALAYAALAGLSNKGIDAIAARARRGCLTTDVQFLFFTLAALEQAGRGDAVIAAIRHGLTPMVADGSETVYERYEARRSLNWSVCQAAGAVAGYFLPRVIGGIRLHPRQARTVTIAPCCDNLAWAEATVPTPDGSITVFWKKSERGKIRLTLTLPNRQWKAKIAPADKKPIDGIRIVYAGN